MRFSELIPLICLFCNVKSLKIFGLFPVQCYSHFGPALRLMNALVDQGHDVTVAAVYADKNAKYKHIHLKELATSVDDVNAKVNIYDSTKQNWIENALFLNFIGEKLTRDTLNSKGLKTLLSSEQKFDIVILDYFINEATRGLCHKYNSACVLFSALPNPYWTNDVMGNPDNPAYNPHYDLMNAGKLSFLDRVKNTFLTTFSLMLRKFSYLPMQEKILREHFPEAPSLSELYDNVDVMLVNAHPGMTDPLPRVPSMVEIGGFHVKPPEKLPKELQSFLDGAKDGVILFSMGSVIKSNAMPKEKMSIILKSFSKLKQKVLWKMEDDVSDLPKNVKTMKWVPQQSVLAHPNVVAFVTHSGLYSSIETIYFGVPVVAIPIFVDQMYNAWRSVAMGIGVFVDFDKLSPKVLDAALNEVLSNPTYSATAKSRSEILKDQPLDPLQKAVYWIEYAYRHKGSKHMKSPILELSWYQYTLLDVIAFIALLLVAILTTLLMLFRCIFCRSKTSKVCEKKKNK